MGHSIEGGEEEYSKDGEENRMHKYTSLTSFHQTGLVPSQIY